MMFDSLTTFIVAAVTVVFMKSDKVNDNHQFVNTNMFSHTNSAISPSSSIECEMDNEDSWVFVKKQNSAVSPSPSDQSQTGTRLPDNTEQITTVVEKKKEKKHALANNDKNKGPLHNDNTLAGEMKAAIPEDLPLSMKSKPPTPLLANEGRRNGKDKSVVFRKFMPIGALSIANKRLRADNLERRLKELGGLRNWLMSYKDLHRFIEVFERKKVGVYQLANVISMSLLKNMGFAPVGPRRKLICEIDRLCRPYCFKSL